MTSRKPRRKPPRPEPQRFLYIAEWMHAKNVSDEELAARLNVSRAQIWKWCNEQHRLNPPKIVRIAKALGIRPEELWHLPTFKSLNSIVADSSEEIRDTAIDIVTRLVRRHH